jgi:hypothetical protein
MPAPVALLGPFLHCQCVEEKRREEGSGCVDPTERGRKSTKKANSRYWELFVSLLSATLIE